MEEKRPVVRPRKYDKLELDNNDLHDFNILKVDQWHSEQYIRIYQEIALPLKISKRFSTFKKEEIRNYYASCGNDREAARALKLRRSNKYRGFKGGKA